MAVRSGRERPEKILVAMHRLAGGKAEFLKYEDIVVEAFQMFPDEFALRGHPEFPDSSDIHKPLYGVLKRHGLVKAANKMFALTPRGIERAARLVNAAGTALDQARSPDRLSRTDEAEIDRLVKSSAFHFFAGGEKNRVLDTDFYACLGCTVRTGRNDFKGRLTATKAAIESARTLKKPDPETARRLGELMEFLETRFSREIEWKEKSHG